jgi:bacterioferritin
LSAQIYSEDFIIMTVQTQETSRRSSAVHPREDDDRMNDPIIRETLLERLNHDLAGEYQAILMYIHYFAKLTGPYGKDLRALLQAEIGDEQGRAQFLADTIVALGGEPTTEPRPVPDADNLRAMLEQAVAVLADIDADLATNSLRTNSLQAPSAPISPQR